MFIKIKDISSESVSSLACILRGAVSSNNRLRLSKKVINVLIYKLIRLVST